MVEVVTDFLSWGSKITVGWLQPWNQKTIASWQESDDKSRQCVEKQRYHSADKGPYNQGQGLPSGHLRFWELDCKEAECQKMDAFELWCWRRFLKVPWTAKRSNQSILREISSEYSLEGLMLKLKLQYFGHLMWKTDTLEKSMMLGKTEGRRRRGCQKMRWLDSITDTMKMNLGKLQEMTRDKEVWRACMGSQRVRQDWAAEQQHPWLKVKRTEWSLSSSIVGFF